MHRPDLRTVSANSFGYGGVNAHVIIERAPARQTSSPYDYRISGKRVSAHDEKALTHGCNEMPDAGIAQRIKDSATVSYADSPSCQTLDHHESRKEHSKGTLNGAHLESKENSNTGWLFTITAVTREQLFEVAHRLQSWVSAQSEATMNSENLAYNLFARRSVFQWRYAFQASSREGLLSRLNKGIVPVKNSKMLKTLFIFTGQGAQWYSMGRELSVRFSAFQDSLLRSEEILKVLGSSWALIHELERGEQDSRIDHGELAQPASTALQIALVDLLASFGARPGTVIGHSSGEVAAAYAAGAISHNTALKISYLRSLLLPLSKQKNPAKGAMLSVGLGEREVLPFLEQMKTGTLSLACINSPYSTTVSGDESAVLDLQKRLNAIGVFNRRLKVDTAYHSHYMQKVADDYFYSLGTIEWSAVKDKIVFISSVTGTKKHSDFGSSYWVENLVSKVRFSKALEEYCHLECASSHTKDARHVCIEVGPHRTLEGPIQQTLRDIPVSLDYFYLPTLIRGHDSIHSILSLSAKLFELGYGINLRAVNRFSEVNSKYHVLPTLPTYPWDHSTTYWYESRLSKDYRFRHHACHDLLGVKVPSSPDLEPTWRYVFGLDSLPWLADHVIDGLVTFSGAGYIAMAIEASMQIADMHGVHPQSIVLRDIHFIKALVIPPAPEKIEVQLCFRSVRHEEVLWYEFRVYAVPQNGTWHEHCHGRVSASEAELEIPQFSKTGPIGTHGANSRSLGAGDVYGQLRSSGNSYGPSFACVQELQITNSRTTSQVAVPDIKSTMPGGFQQPHVLHPTTLDAILHSALPLYGMNCALGSVMPTAIEELSVSLQISNMPGDVLEATLELSQSGVKSAFANISASAAAQKVDGQAMLIVSNMQLLGTSDLRLSCRLPLDRYDIGYQFLWTPQMASKRKDCQYNYNSLRSEETHNSHDWTGHLFSPHKDPGTPAKDEAASTRNVKIIVAQSCREFGATLMSVLAREYQSVTATTWDLQDANTQAVYIILDDSRQPFLESPSAELFQHVIKVVNSTSIILWVSVHVSSIDANARPDPKSALVSGFARSARAEREQLNFTVLDVQSGVSKDFLAISRTISDTLTDLLRGSDEIEYVYRDGQVFVPRLLPDPHLNGYLARTGKPKMHEVPYWKSEYALKLDVDSLRTPGSLNFTKDLATLEPLESTQVLTQVCAHSFSSRHGDLAAEKSTGSTPIVRGFAGTVIAVGSEAQSTVKVGDAVLGWSLNGPAFISVARAGVSNITRLPSEWLQSYAPAMVSPLMAAYYSIVEIAKLREGRSILVHGAASLYGHCAIATAKVIGAEIYATASSEEERIGIATAFDLPWSRVLSGQGRSLRRQIFELTAGKGIDVVLNMPCQALSLDLVGCVAAVGVHVRLLRSGAPAEAPLSNVSRQAITFASFDLETIALHRPEILAGSLEKAVSMAAGWTPPFNRVKNVPLPQLQDVLAEVVTIPPETSESIVLTANAETIVSIPYEATPIAHKGVRSLRPDATYVIAGGLGDLGQRISALMANRGAVHIVLLSRRLVTQESINKTQETLRQAAPNLKLYAFQCDIMDHSAVGHVAESLRKLMLPPVYGVIQSATVLHDRVLERMTVEDWQLPLQAKLYGTRNLDEAFNSSSLDFFIMLSSLSGVVGTRGQANYAAGNAYQDAFAQCNGSSRTAYIALDMGMIEDSTAYQDHVGQTRARNLLRQGWIPIKSEQFTAILEWVLSPETWQRGSGQYVIGIDGSSIIEAEDPTPTTQSAMFSQVRGTRQINKDIKETPPSGRGPQIEDIDTPENALKVVANLISEKVSSFISVGEEDATQNKPLQDLGLDSLTAIEVKNFVRKEFDAAIHVSEVLDAPDLTALSGKVASRSVTLQKKFGDSLKKAEKKDAANDDSEDFRAKSNNEGNRILEEGRLPALPLPSVDDSLELYLSSIRPFLDAKDMERTLTAARMFKEASGEVLQRRLESRLQRIGAEGWHYDLQIPGIYLRRRSPILPFGTFYGVHQLTETVHSQSERAAVIAETAYAFKKELEAGKLAQDYLNEEPLCPRSLDWLFNACREPLRTMDRVQKHQSNNHMIVLRRGHAFKVFLEEGGQPVRHTQLRDVFEKILQISVREMPSVATLTADERDSWAELRDAIKDLGVPNTTVLGAIEAAAFVICLDDVSPNTPTERCNPLILGDPGNRWSDKTLQFVVYANGSSGYICEHSMLDAASLRQLNVSVTNAIIRFTPETEHQEFLRDPFNILEELQFDINDLLVGSINRIQKHVKLTSSPIEIVHHTLPSMGQTFFRNQRVPPKAGIQAIIQLASRIYYGRQFPSWETLTMMSFRYGRLDWIQSVSPAMFTFCDVAFDESIHISRRSKLLREAASSHASTMMRISRGRGFAAHLEALQEIAQQEGISPDFFKDPTWSMMSCTSARKLKTDASEGMNVQEAGFFMPDPESVFIHYELEELDCRLYVQSTEGRTNGFCRALEEAAKQVRQLLMVS